ncbi:hypothetical protein HRbin36_02540 [bacterium HR36]|nr:hypothetical protein HRbin36_02540 [bacterium HR36]
MVRGRSCLGGGIILLNPKPVGPIGGSDGASREQIREIYADNLSNTMDILPVVGTGKATIELVTGWDIVTGEPVPRWASAINVVISLVPVLPRIKNACKGPVPRRMPGRPSPILVRELRDVDPNKLHHIFIKNLEKHQLKDFLASFGGNMEEALRAIHRAAVEAIENSPELVTSLTDPGIDVMVNGFRIHVRDNIVNGELRIGTVFIPRE